MIKHLIKLVWNRKRENVLMSIELFFAFMVLAMIATQSYSLYERWKQPLGFSYENIWHLSINTNSNENRWTEERIKGYENLIRELKSIDGVESVTMSSMTPFHNMNWNSSDSSGILAQPVMVERMGVDDNYAETMGIRVIEGRWYEKADDALDYYPVVVNQALAKALYGDESPIGKQLLPRYETPEILARWQKRFPNRVRKQNRIVGVVDAFRKQGEFDETKYFAFSRVNTNDTLAFPPENFFIRVRADKMTGEFEAAMVKRLEPLIPGWTYATETLKAHHDQRFKETISPMITFAIVGGFLILMISLGIVGVVWQNVARRTREIGLRRAVGSTANLIYSQVLLELLVVAVFAIVVGSFVFLQFPILDVPFLGFIEGLSWRHYLVGCGASCVVLLAIAFLCALYPSRVATTVAPTEALRYE
ncbi:MAG: FtsX-like permease family protein [Chloroherpetonaceae bacterium]|nr:FtsX-like permease family protein [Chloroherpetonaceae bacterium]